MRPGAASRRRLLSILRCPTRGGEHSAATAAAGLSRPSHSAPADPSAGASSSGSASQAGRQLSGEGLPLRLSATVPPCRAGHRGERSLVFLRPGSEVPAAHAHGACLPRAHRWHADGVPRGHGDDRENGAGQRHHPDLPAQHTRWNEPTADGERCGLPAWIRHRQHPAGGQRDDLYHLPW